MLIKEDRDTKKKRKRERILEAAAELFSHKSYHEVMMEDVAKLTSVAKGTVYNYFASKEELYFSIMHMRMENLINSLNDKIKTEVNSIDSLRTFVIHLYMFMMKYQNFFLMYVKESFCSGNGFCDELKELEAQLRSILKEIIISGKKENLFRNVDEDFSVNSVIGSIYGSVQKGIENNVDEQQKKADREQLFEFVLHGLYSGFKNNKVLPLKSKSIVITRTVEQSKESSSLLTRLGADVIIFPTLEIVPPSSWQAFDEIVAGEGKIDFIIFTSAHAVVMFLNRCRELGVKTDYSKLKIVAVGNKTAAVCERNNIPVHIIPQKFSAEGVVEKLSKFNLKNKIVFIPRSAIGREELPRGLKDLGAIIKSVPVYNVSLPTKENIKRNIKKLNEAKPDLFIFTSPSTFVNFLQILDIKNAAEYFKKYDVAAIGPTTKAAIEKRKVPVNIMPDEYTIDGLIKKIVNHYTN